MKRFHVHVSVDNLDHNIRFYSALFGTKPSIVKEDYAKWMLDDPNVNFAISQRGDKAGVNHLGIQVESDEELEVMRAQLTRADQPLIEQVDAACCYAKSNKHWVQDPQGVAWETFHSLANIPVFGLDTQSTAKSTAESLVKSTPIKAAACCVPRIG